MTKTTTTTWKRSKAIEGRIIADNGRNLIEDEGYVSVAVDKHWEGGYMLRIWTRAPRPVKGEWFKLQSEAKAVAVAILAHSLTESDRDLQYWVANEFHDIYMAALYSDVGYTYPRTAR